MAYKQTPVLLLVCIATTCSARDRADLLNTCMDAKHHKTRPGPEDKLHDQVLMSVVLSGRRKSRGGGEQPDHPPQHTHSELLLDCWGWLEVMWWSQESGEVAATIHCSLESHRCGLLSTPFINIYANRWKLSVAFL